MKAAIIYASNSGSTYLSAKIIKEQFEDNGYEVTLKKAAVANSNDISNNDLILLGTNSWKVDGKEGQPQETMTEFLNEHASELTGKGCAVFGCGDSSYIQFCGGVDTVEQIAKDHNAKLFMPSLRIDSFYFKMDENIKMINAWAQVLVENVNKSK